MKRTFLFVLLFLTTACGSNDTNPSSMDVSGNWVGTYQTTRCDSDGPGCGLLPGGGFSLTLVQTGSSVTGSMQYGNVLGNVTGTTSNGNISLNPWTFTTTASSGAAPAVFEHSAQTFRTSGNRLTGTFHVNVTVTGTGGLSADAVLIGVVRS